MKIRVGVDAERSRLGRLTMSDGSGTSSAVDVCATGNVRDPLRPGGPAPYGTYTLKEARPVDGAMVPELGDTTLVFEPRSGAARMAESLGRFVLELHAGRAGDDGRLRITSRGLRVWPETLVQIAMAVARGESIELEIYEAPLTLWDRIFFCRRRYSRGFGTSDSTRDYDDGWRSSSSSSSSSSRDDSFSGKGGQFGGGGASGSWDSAARGAAVAGGAALGAGIAAASESSSSDSGSSTSDDSDSSSSGDTSGSEGSTGY
jgi:hypothetical protein